MKKSTILLSLALLLALSAGAFAALSTDITGWVETDIVYKKNDPIKTPNNPFYLEARMRGRVQLTMGSTNDANPKVTISMETAANETDWINFENALERKKRKEDDDEQEQEVSMPFKITGIQMVATGAWWKGGPELTTSIGSFNRNWSHYGAYRLGRNIIEVDGLSVGPVKVTVLYAYTEEDEEEESRYNKTAGNTFALRGSGTIDPVQFNAYFVNYGPQTNADARYNQFAVDAKVTPASGVDLSGVFGYEEKNKGITYKAEAKVTTIPNLTLTGLVRATDDKYNPAHTERHDDHRVWWKDEMLLRVGAETTQAGVKLNGSVERKTNYAGKNPTNKFTVGASTTISGVGDAGLNLGGSVELTRYPNNTSSTTTVIDASTAISNVNVTYKGTIETDKEMINDVTVKTTVNLFFADNVTLEGRVIFDENQSKDHHKLRYGARAYWRLPNGLDIWVGYANWNMSGKDWVNKTGDDGFYIRLHRRMNL